MGDELDRTLQAACRSAVELLGVDHSAMAVVLPDEGRVEVLAEYPEDVGARRLEIRLTGAPAEERLFGAGEPVKIPDVAADSDLGDVRGILLSIDIRSVLVVPVVSGGRVIGSFSMNSLGKTREFSEADIDLCKVFARLAGVAIENAKLLERATGRANQLEALRGTTLAITSPLDRTSLLDAIVEQSVKLLKARTGGIYEYYPDLGELTVIADHHRPSNFGKTLKVGEGMAGRLVESREPFMIVEDYNQWDEKAAIYGDGRPFGAVLEVPLKWKGDTIGVLYVDDEVGRTFTYQDAHLLGMFADQAAIAVVHAKLEEEQINQNGYLNRLVASSPDGIIAVDNHGRVTEFNARAEQILQYGREEVLGRFVGHLYYDRNEPINIGGRLRAAQDGRLTNYETFVRSKSGIAIPILISATWLYDGKGDVVGSIGHFEDRRAIKEVEYRLETVLKASNVVANAKSLRMGLDRLAEMIVSVLGSAFCRLLLLHQNASSLVVEAAYLSPSENPNWNPRVGKPIPIDEYDCVGKVLRSDQPAVVSFASAEGRRGLEKLSRGLGLEQDVRELLLTPIKVGNKVVGLLSVGATGEGDNPVFTNDKQALAAAIVAQTAVLIDRFRYEEINERRRKRLAALNDRFRHLRGDKEITRLQQEVVRLAVELAEADFGGLYLNSPKLKQIELTATYPVGVLNGRLLLAENVARNVVATGRCQRDDNASASRTIVGVPLLEHDGDVTAVLFVTGDERLQEFFDNEIGILERFAEQSSVALQNAKLMGLEQREFNPLKILHKISDYIQEAEDLEKILHVVLTGVTAGYGLGLNRAVLLLLDQSRKILVGQMGIGELDSQKAQASWDYDHKHGLYNFGPYVERLEKGQQATTPVGDMAKTLRIRVDTEGNDVFSRVVKKREPLRVQRENLGELPEPFRRIFEPQSTVVVVPLVARGSAIGLLVVDNKFTEDPITDELLELLITFANSAAIAVGNLRLLQDTKLSHQRMKALFEASDALVSPVDPDQVLASVVEQARLAADAELVRMILIDEFGNARMEVASGNRRHDLTGSIRREGGISMDVMNTGEFVAIEDVEDVEARGRVNPIYRKAGIKAALCLPLSLHGRRIGVVWVSYDRPRPFPRHEIEPLQLFVNHAALAYDNARRFRDLKTTSDAAQLLSEKQELEEVLMTIVEGAKDISGADFATIWPYDHDRKIFIPDELRTLGIPSSEVEKLKEFDPTPNGATYTVLGEEYIAVTDVKSSQVEFLQEPPTLRETLGRVGIRSFQGIALTVGKHEPVGVLYVSYAKPRGFGEEDRKLLGGFASYAALSLKRARLFDQLKKAKKAARVVAKTATTEPLAEILLAIARETKDAIGCDAVTVYACDQDTGQIHNPPGMAGVHDTNAASRFEMVVPGTLADTILKEGKRIVVDRVAHDERFRASRFSTDENIEGCVAVPLNSTGRKVGLMFVNYRQRHNFLEEEVESIELFADQAAVAIRNAQLFDENDRKLKQQANVVELSRELLGTLDLKKTMNRAVEVAAALLDADFCNVVLFDKDGNLVIQAVHAWPDELVGSRVPSGIGSQTGFTIMRQRPVFVDDFNAEGRFARQPFGIIHGVKSGLSVPMYRDQKIVGAMLVHSKRLRRFTESEAALLELIAGQTAIAAQSAQRYEAIERTSKTLSALYEASEAITKASLGLERGKILDDIVKAVRLVTPTAVLGALLTYDGEKDELLFESIYPPEEKANLVSMVGDRRPRAGNEKTGYRRGIIGRAVDEKRAQLVNDVGERPSFADSDYVELHPKTRSELAVPLMDQDKVLGVLNVESDQVGAFDEEASRALQALAELAVVVILNAQQYEDLKETKGLVGSRTALAWMGMASSAWWHSVKNDAVTISHVTELLREDLDFGGEDLPHRFGEKLARINALAASIKQKDIIPPLSPESAISAVLIENLIRERVKQLWANEPYKIVKRRLNLSKRKTGTVRASTEWLRRAFDILVDNAVESMLKPTRVPDPRLTITTSHKDGFIEIELADKGRGIPKEVREKLFKEPIAKEQGSKGLGIGLLMAQAIVQTYGGDIRVTRSDSEGTAFVVRLPVETRTGDLNQ
ncbi:MAG TPA: GAF domain-containing protein [Blastocatellia bacterium]|nr:GAF domain-containing protein [Blastocatellia bacterium]